MLTKLFETVLAMSFYGLAAGVGAVLLCRLFRRVHASRSVGFLLWAVAAIRLVCPYALQLPFYFQGKNVENDIRTIIETGTERSQILGNTYKDTVKWTREGMENYEKVVKELGAAPLGGHTGEILYYEETEDGTIFAAKTAKERWMPILAVIWLLGVLLFWGYGLVSWLLFRRKLRFAMRVEPGIYEVDTIRSSCVFGLIRPRIYLIPNLTERQRAYILCHEKEHIRHHDQIWELLAYGIMGLHWFNVPLWAVCQTFRNELERYCDERVLTQVGEAKKEDYGQVILEMAVQKTRFSFAPLAFGEHTGKKVLKDRITQILKYQKPRKSVQAALLLLSLALGCGLLFCGPVKAGEQGKTKNAAGKEENSAEEETEDVVMLSERLFEEKHPYVGDAAANGALLSVLRGYFPGDFTTELETDEEPYVLRLVFEPRGEEESRLSQENAVFSAQNYENLSKGAAVLLALIDNLDTVEWRYPLQEAEVSALKEENPEKFEGEKIGPYLIRMDPQGRILNIEPSEREDELSMLLGSCGFDDLSLLYGIEEIKAYGESPEKVQELLEILRFSVGREEDDGGELEN